MDGDGESGTAVDDPVLWKSLRASNFSFDACPVLVTATEVELPDTMDGSVAAATDFGSCTTDGGFPFP